MKVEVTLEEGGALVLKEIYSGVFLETREGNRLGICMRDDTFEINIVPSGTHPEVRNWWRVDMQTGKMIKGESNSTTGEAPCACPDSPHLSTLTVESG